MNAALTEHPTASAVGAAGATLPPTLDPGALPPSVGDFHYTRFAPWTPPLESGVEPGQHPVVIVGGGPVGMSLALGLANHGLRSMILEADDTVCVGSRAACISRRSLQIVERLGALPAFIEKGLAWTGGRSFYKTEEVFRFEMPHDTQQKLPPMINLEQYYIEHYLLDEIVRRNERQAGLIDIRWATELTGFTQGDEGLTLQVRNPQGEYELRAAWMVACDGGQSFVRKALGLNLDGTAYEGRYVIIDIELHSKHPTERRAWFDPPWNPGSTVLMHRQPDDIWRIDYQLRPGQDSQAALEPDAVREFVTRHLQAIGEGDLPWKCVWTSIYRAGAMSLESYRHGRGGRILFAGNAAHAMPIFGVRGLNSGFDDADNLAWKLAQVARGLSDASLLDSYSDERIAAFHVNAESAMRSTEFMSPPSRGFDLLREAALSLAGAHPEIARLINPRQTEAVRYDASPLSTPDMEHWPCGPMPGQVMPDLPLERGHLSDLLQEPGFALIVLAAAEAESSARQRAICAQARQQAVAQGLTLQMHDLPRSPGSQATFEALGAGDEGAVYLLRPDGHVAARWRQPTAQALVDSFARAAARKLHATAPASPVQEAQP
ncbi:FAD-dependent monooxygenase [Variovorax dokdonensis]|uniref:FAD-dependent monooxygenase n=1 Tax=Variovorax dokdonensis TaxID=344883 RepID=A0ABT7NG98_9BURK|nr:FAD-dependent monooxygenase [Variovorax dokdonensis]MDM0046978.1 FAD-dependent monooxygenase [Variovorax dokdonensis]